MLHVGEGGDGDHTPT